MGIWKVVDDENGVFQVNNPHNVSHLYFPLTNTQGSLFSSITPNLTGDIKTSINSYLNYPQTVYDLNALTSARTLWVKFNDTAVNASPLFSKDTKTMVQAGPLFHRFAIEHKDVRIETLNFVAENLPCEVMKFTVTNKTKKDINAELVFAMPLFARSADNLRDHRHVTALLARSEVTANGVEVTPTMCFDERGHTVNKTTYFVAGYTEKGKAPVNVVTTQDEFLGEGGRFDVPAYIFGKKPAKAKSTDGKEPMAALDFGKVTIKAGKSVDVYALYGITDGTSKEIIAKLGTPDKVKAAFEASLDAWSNVFNMFGIKGGKDFGFWTRWVNMQPTLRKLLGCSFLPHFDYGRGGRGWRDLWQDQLGLLLFSPEETRQNLVNNFKGVRIDGSNATIITKAGGFLADRNKISRVWMDHGVWPYLTLKLYVDQTGDFDVLFEQIPFFKDNLLRRAKLSDPTFPESDNKLRTHFGQEYTATVFEHTLLQNVVQFYNIGEHGNTKLEDADWNDGLDMGHKKGESVAFTHMFVHNLRDMATLLRTMKAKKNVQYFPLTEELLILLDTMSNPVDYSDRAAKRATLEKYFDFTLKSVSGNKVDVNIDHLAMDLEKKADSLQAHLRANEWIKELGIYNGYYDNAGKRVEGKHKNGTRVTLTSGVFSMMSGVATDDQCKKIYKAFTQFLQDKESGTFRLNSDFKEVKLDMGRAFAFAYGEKENGAVFAHMDVMFCFALYKRGMIDEGYQLLKGLFDISASDKSFTYPCISEYYNADSRGLYSFLTGSASWTVYLLVTEVFGVKHTAGDLTLTPKLAKAQFASDKVSFDVKIDGKRCTIVYVNEDKLGYDDYAIVDAKVNGIVCTVNNPRVFTLEKSAKAALLNKEENVIEITLA
jgi:cellobiose phosphorylase